MIDLRLRARVPQEALDPRWGLLVPPDDFDVLLTGPARVRMPDNRPLCVYLPGAVRQELEEAYPVLTTIRTPTDNRGPASGSKLVKQAGQRQTRAKIVLSSVVGSMDAFTGRHHGYCRLTAFNAHQAQEFDKLVPLLQAMDEQLAQHVPDRWNAQAAEAEGTHPDWVIPGTTFTTVTVNNTYPTGVHTDKGDLDAGYSCLAVWARGYDGGRLAFPEYRVAIDVRHGDLVLMDAHAWHGNTPLLCKQCGTSLDKPHVCEDGWQAERISVVAYYRTNMRSCGSSEDENAKRMAMRETRNQRHLEGAAHDE